MEARAMEENNPDVPGRHMWTAPVGKRFDVANSLVGFCHMSGLFARLVPLALMKSDSLGP
jgi:hypothetical protein